MKSIRKIIREELKKMKPISVMTDSELADEYSKLSFAKSRNQKYDAGRFEEIKDEVLFNRKLDLSKFYR